MSLFGNLNISSLVKLKRNLKLVFLFSLLSLLSTISFAQEVKVKVDTTNIRIGEQFNFQITVDDTANVIIPKLENLKGLEILEDIPTDTLDRNLIKKYLLTSFDSGAYYIPSQQVFIRNRAYITDSILINVATVAIDTTKQKMFPIKAIQSEPFTFDDFKPYIIWIVLALLLIAALIYYLKTRKKKEVIEKEVIIAIPAFEEAIAKLKELDEKLLWQNNKVKQYYTELTDIIQNYLGRDVEIPTAELTSSEIIELVETQNSSRKLGIERDTLKNLGLLFKNADLVKFAKSKPLSHEIEGDRRLAERIISKIQPKVKEYKEAIAAEQGTVIETPQPVTQTTAIKQIETKKPSWLRRNRVLVIIGSILLALIIAAAIIIPILIGKYLPPTVAQLAEKEWVTKTYGAAPSITLSSPVELTKQADLEVPEEIKQLIIASSNYSYSNWLSSIEILITTNSYDPSVQTSLDGAVSAMQTSMTQEEGVTVISSKLESYSISSVEGRKISGTINQRGDMLSYTAIVLADENRMWTIMLSHEEGHAESKAIIDRIINSIKIDLADVE
jgi:hypothetical protein